MSDLTVGLIITGSVIAYLLMVGSLHELLKKKSLDLSHGPMALLGPVVFVSMLGAAITRWVSYRLYLRK